MKSQSDIGVVGLAVMGENLILNMAHHGFTVTAFNRTTEKLDRFLAGRARGQTIRGAWSVERLVQSLAQPRKIMLMVKAGPVVDTVIEDLLPYLEPGDIIIDGGNSHFSDSNRRSRQLEELGLHFVAAGVSGGEEGALTGPSIMPSGSVKAWPALKPIFQTISAKVDDGTPCCDWVGPAGSGHFVKMVHNGIEYGDMQLICEAYDLMKNLLGLTEREMSTLFSTWNSGELNSYLIEITGNILAYEEDGEPLVEKILDHAGQKGTGKWTGIAAFDLGVPLTLIGEAVFARFLSAQKAERVEARKVLDGPSRVFDGDKQSFVEEIREALLCAKIVSYAQGYVLMRQAAEEFGWELNYAGIADMWRGGCIIRSVFLADIKSAFTSGQPKNLLTDPYFAARIRKAQGSWRRVVARAVEYGVPMPAMTSALAYFDGYRRANLPANLLQAQRDYFGAHTYRRVDRDENQSFHTNWTGRGGTTASGSYDA